MFTQNIVFLILDLKLESPHLLNKTYGRTIISRKVTRFVNRKGKPACRRSCTALEKRVKSTETSSNQSISVSSRE